MTDKKTPEGLEFWKQVEESDPAHIKEVSRGKWKFHAIDAMYQIKRATEMWGPVGKAWSWLAEKEIIDLPGGPLFLVSLALKTPLGDAPIQTWASCPLMRGDRIDADACKKAMTDALTKALSYTGMNADVFLGRFDDNRYVSDERAQQGGQQSGGITTTQQTTIQDLAVQLFGDGAADEVAAILSKKGLKSINDLSKGQASTWIGSWIEKAKAQREGGGDGSEA